ncbi:group 1 truncated hemoglobin [Accumulibacter sp.]|uniref:group I truncated hemoglobin n=1 Tax=Accumulibacter sp. TaxID=2053492 RepID=UPI0025D90EE6|nr:group 1 truncated hemoglobin [Accumulibacter sp.]MCM8610861.1 group 1 truncated hemoglobin [Accumulibacter sp.]MCM8635307.1 group 1 truncated hemoglobin [Accumulibacter sp.]MCM8639023.1 group 1 truncated hemoglobin [Accumulibacter sp.]
MNALSRLILGTAFSLTLVACAGGPGTRSPSLYDRLGGQPAITAVVDDFVANVAADKRINAQFANTDIPRLKMLLVEQICAGTGGPCRYTGRDMKSAHAHLKISQADFASLVEDLTRTLDKFKVPAREQNELIAILAPMKSDIVTVK